MALFTDGNIATLSDLRAYETSILDVTAAEGIDVGSKLSLARRELGFDLLGFLLRQGHSTLHRDLRNVVVTEPLMHAHTMLTLALIYRDVYNSQLNDRYEGKWKQYSELARSAVRQLFDIGIGITWSPIAKADVPVATLIPGGTRPATTYTFCAAAIGINGNAGAISDPLVIEVPAGLNVRAGQNTPLPANATGWALYAAENDGPSLRQTDQPLSANETWECSPEGLRTDLPAITLQSADFYAVQRQQILRG